MIRALRFVLKYVQNERILWGILVLLLCFSYGALAMALNSGVKFTDGDIDRFWRRRPEILIITPSGDRYTQLADLTRLSQTLSLVSDIHWIVVEDSAQRSEKIVKLLNRTKVPSTHLTLKTPLMFPGRGWAQRNYALSYLRNKFQNASSAELKKIVYFGDDDNTYDIRLFDNYIRNVQRIGAWAVGLAGGALVEAPRVNQYSVVVGWDTEWAPTRPFAIDMAGFAISLKLILKSNATFKAHCNKRQDGPETCFIEQFGVRHKDLEPFGVNGDPKEVLVWHTKTEKYQPLRNKSDQGYIF